MSKSNGFCVVALLLLGLSSATWAADQAASASESSESKASGGPSIEITELIAQVAKRTGKQFILDPRVRGPVPVAGLDLQRVDYPRLLAILRLNMYATYEAGGAVNVLPDANARQLPTPVTVSVGAQVPDDEWVTVVVQGKSVCAAQLVPVLRPLMPQAAHLAALPQTNSLIISDHAANARKILELFDRLEKQAAALKQNCTESAKSSG
jgi:general secretion pathway protein D